MLKMKTMAVIAAACMAGAASAATTHGFANGGFETDGGGGQIAAGWLTAATNSPASRSTEAHSGSYALRLSAPNGFDASIALQDSVGHGGLPPLTAANVGDTPWLSFWAKGDAGTTGNAFVKLQYFTASGNVLALDRQFQALINPDSWSQISFQAAAIPSGTGTLFLEIGTAVGPLLDGRPNAVLVDDLQFMLTTAAVPEPGSVLLLAAGLAGLGAIARRRR
ncbi:PEP-CTERM sorting domain-containing protein [Aquabacterium sp. OR-4]|uniref:PEP-CTERM sorting domain-containing protein n=1 Tax=Aquabacterium sp. OR-4 TaxID=2978127 RepID=UPI0028C9A0D5|nr:PEP-CTERM sorting domain-containing protein [Aquabacterium sp. OR-4]MDT7838669.1 PEP-CTERM sorting domain-containing protein [Aquabacterium sp. OR-4]